MSSGAKRPPPEVSAFAPGPPPCKPKRRKQSTPVRISGELGLEPPLPPPSPASPPEHLLRSPDAGSDAQSSPSPGQFRSNAYQNKENYLDLYEKANHHEMLQQQPTMDRYNSSGYYHKYREQLLDEECGPGLTISRVPEVEQDKDDAYRNTIKNEKLNDIENSNAYRSRSVIEEQDSYDKYRKVTEKQDEGAERLQESPEDRYSGSNERHPCGRCGILFPSLDSLRVHYENEHVERNGRLSQGIECKVEPYEADETSPRTSSAPTPAPVPDPRMEAWSAEFQAKMADIYKNALSFPHEISKEGIPPNFNPLCPPFSLFPTAVPPQRPLMEPIRIFNPEAYCELCSKEFCNKYFLKTHKANKHGIYENTPANSGTEGLNLESSIMPAALASSALKFKNNMMLAEYAKSYEAALLASQRHKVKIQRMMEEARDLDKGDQGGLNMSMNARHLDDVRSSSDDNTIPENFIFKGDLRQDSEETYTTPTPRKLSPDSSKRARDSGFNADTLRRLGVINPEAFCKICCKEYCNKYFLKTHKIKRHGLLPSPTEKHSNKEPPAPIQPVEVQERKEGQTSPLNLIMGEDQEKLQSSPDPNAISKIIKAASVPHQNNIRPHSTQSIESSGIDEKRENSNEESVKNENAKQSPTTIFISEDLQKLQTMISQLNDLSVNKIVECYICKKEFENNYILQFHMMSDHGISVSGTVDSFNFPSVATDDVNSDSPQQLKANCTLCDKEFPSMLQLKKHIEEYHSQKNNFNDAKPPSDMPADKEVQRERRASMSLTPTNSYCEICNKELCNKYFMKTHMQRMHGIEIENGTQIGGVICDICNKELCSKYFLRVHKHNTHGIVEPGTPLPQMRNLSGEQDNSFNNTQVASPLKPMPETSILSSRFIAHFVEVCPFCSRRFRTSKWLKAHLLSDHGKAGVDKWKELEVHYKAQSKVQSGKNTKQVASLSIPDNNSNIPSTQNASMEMQERIPFYSKINEPKILNIFSMNNSEIKTYNCSYCPFSTSILSFLYVHEKSHAQGPEMDILCPMCPESFNKPEALQIHIITAHSLPEWKERPGHIPSPSSNRECQSRQMKTPPSDNNDDKREIQASNGNSKAELFECYECDFKSCSFGEMESHLKSQHCAVKDGTFDNVPDADCESFNDDGRRKNKMPAIYAVPRSVESENESSEQTSITMQPFVIEENTSEVGGGKFVPSVVFLPVRRRATGMITISFNLTPA